VATYDVGDLVRIGNWSGNTATAAFALLTGTATDPTAVLLTIKTPDPTADDLVYGWPLTGVNGLLTHESTGRFYVDAPMTLEGVWYFRLAGTGAVTAAVEGSFYVQASRV
jgi:hypothetical protein